MAEDEAGEGGARKAPPKSRKKLIIVAAAAALLVVGGAAGAYRTLAGGKDKSQAEASGRGEQHGGHDDKADAHGKAGAEEASKVAKAFVELPEMTVNLATVDREKQRYVRLAVALEVDRTEVADAIKPMMPRVLDSFLTHLRELRPDDIRGSSGAYRLKEELLRRVNVAVAPAKVDAVLFKDIVVQ